MVKKTESVLESENANLGMASKNGLLEKECRYGIMEMGICGSESEKGNSRKGI